MKKSFTCQACAHAAGEFVLDLGIQPLANNLLGKEDLARTEPKFPLRVIVCPACWLLQIADLVPPVQLFSEYLYFSSFSDAMVRHAAGAAERYRKEFALGPRSLVVEIASNDGYLLKNFQKSGVPCLGIEPAGNVAQVARDQGIETVVDFFGEQCGQRLVKAGRRADLLLGNNVFAHAPEINDFIKGIHTLLDPRGRCVLEFPYAVDLIEKTEFDTIYHEHVFYFTLTALHPLFRRHGLDIFDLETIPIHGGSLRLFIAHADTYEVQISVPSQLELEEKRGVSSLAYYGNFARQVSALRDEFVALVRKLKRQGNRIAAYGASAKGSTLLNFCGLGRSEIDFIADRSSHKHGRLAPGTHLPIVAASALLEQQPDYTLLLTWNFAQEILEQQQEYRRRGGKFIIPIPQPAVV